MYMKALIPGSDSRAPMPMIIILTNNYDAYVQPLRAAGWDQGETNTQREDHGYLEITTGGLQLIVEGAAILSDDMNPISPPGWWDAVHTLGDKCWAVMAKPESINLADTQNIIPALWGLVEKEEALFTSVSVVS